ncbi:MAG: phospholipase [Bacteroidaceae bacterium]|nr:phospholipase [Bacteroidaceae bacterium]
MAYLILSLFILAAVAMVAGFIREKRNQKKLERGEISELPSIKQVEDMTCCGQHEVCEKDSLLAALSKEIEYYNDEELDRYRGRSSDSYSEDEAEEFREVLYTMKENEVAGWVRSLQLRAVELPDQVKDEVFLIVGERRFAKSS